jgi:class 3 adenylate cyclase
MTIDLDEPRHAAETLGRISLECGSLGRPGNTTSTLGQALRNAWEELDFLEDHADDAIRRQNTPNSRERDAFKGLRVRMGIHSGLHDPAQCTYNKASGRMQYAGAFLSLAKAVSDAADGGMILASEATFTQLNLLPVLVRDFQPQIKLMFL